MLTRLDIHDFRVHEKISLKIDPKITTIIGPTDRGKTSILSALGWVCMNTPDGREFIRDGAKEAAVRLKVDGRTIIRRKGKQNLYLLDGKQFAAFGNDVPDEIANLLNLSPENFQHQHAAPFWLSESAGFVSRELNRIVNLSEMDHALREVDQRLRKARTRLEVLDDLQRDARAIKRGLGWVREARRAYRRVERLAERHDTATHNAQQLHALVKAGESCRVAETVKSEALGPAQTLVATADRLHELQQRRAALSALIATTKRVTVNLTSLSQQLKGAEVRLAKFGDKVCPSCGRTL